MSIGYAEEWKCFTWNGAEVVPNEQQSSLLGLDGWTQSIPINRSCKTKGRIDCLETLGKYRLNQITFLNKSVLVVGGYEGFNLLWAKAHGAREVVGIADDFYEISNYPSARAVLTELFPGSFEWVEGPVEATLKKVDRKFDVVLFSEGLCHRRDPFSLLEAVAAACAETLVLCSPFVIDNSEVPWVAHFPEYTPDDARRDVSSPNRLWLANTLQELGFDLEEFRIWEHDFASIHAIRRPLVAKRSAHLVPSITELPADEGFESDLAVLMITCQRYSSAWHPFFVLFKRYWPECPYRVYMGTDKGSYSNIPTLQTGDDGSAKNWAQRLRSVLAALPEKWVLLFQEDFLFQAPVDNLNVRRLVRHARDCNAAMLRVFSCPLPRSPWLGCKDIGSYGPHEDFRLSLQTAIWDREVLMSLLKDGEDPWLTEFVGSRRTQFISRPFLGALFCPIQYYCTAIMHGEWDDGALELLKREGIPTDDIPKKV